MVLTEILLAQRTMLAVIRKRSVLGVRREGRGGLAQLEAKVIEVALRCRMGAKFIDDGAEVGQRTDWGQSRGICGPRQSA